MHTPAQPSIRAQLVHLSFVIVVVSIALSLAGTLFFIHSRHLAFGTEAKLLPKLRHQFHGIFKLHAAFGTMIIKHE